MSINLIIDDDEPEQIASTTGWGDVCEWAVGLELGDFRNLVSFVEHGVSESVGKVREELVKALADSPPDESHVRSTLDGLLDVLDSAKDAGHMIVSS